MDAKIKNNKTVLVLIFILLFFTILGVIINISKSSKLDILVAPSSAEIIINDQKYKNGSYRLYPGTYQIKIKQPEFKTYQKTIELKPNSSSKLYYALKNQKDPNWYENHPEEQENLKTINDYQADQFQEKASQDPIFKITPFNNYNSGFKITTTNTKDKITINIYLYTCTESEEPILKKNALNWLKSKHINLKNYHLVYKSC